MAHLEQALAASQLVKLTLGAPRGTDETLRNVFVRPVDLKTGRRFQFVYRHDTRDITKNFSAAEARAHVAALLATDFGTAHLFTSEQTIEWDRRRTRLKVGPGRSVAPDTRHDRVKHRVVDAQAPWLAALDVGPDKLRQIDKFVEILSHLIELPKPGLRLVDMGCGKGYLTFAAYDWLRHHGWPQATVTGVERRPELVEQCNRIARQHSLTGLKFETGDIAGYPVTADILIALHACNTATDEALAKGIQAGASIIVVAPCCHQELRPQITPPIALRHGILRERYAELLTDAVRAALLEGAGYQTKVFEFISTEHTAKNLMITAVKSGAPGDWQTAKELLAQHGIRRQRLAELLGV